MSLQSLIMSKNQEEEQAKIYQSSFIRQGNVQSKAMRILQIIDIFSFIPVPKDQSVSTKPSLIGSVVFFTLFLTYIIYDFIGFVINNAPITQSYHTQLDNNQYRIPQFAISFMDGRLNNITDTYDGLFTYSIQRLFKSQGEQTSTPINYNISQFNTTGNDLSWMSEKTKQFYYVMRYPSSNTQLKASGLLYTSPQCSYVRAKLFFCTNSSACYDRNTTQMFCNTGRIFLFIKNEPDNSIISLDDQPEPNQNNYILYNFFVIPGFYKRVTINFQVVETTVLPDYFHQFTEVKTMQMKVESMTEQLSVISYLNATDAIAFNFQLAPFKLNNRVSRSTIIDHLSLWGAFWGVLFSIFAIFFLSYNRKKFYRKNPDWDQFKKALKQKLDV